MVELDQKNLKIWQDGNLEYLRYRYPLNKDSIIVDLGSYVGEFTRKLNEEFGCTNITSFDPTDNINAVPYGHKIKACAWIENTRVRTNGAFYYTSQIHDNEAGLHSYDAVDIANYYPLRVDLCKINIEGAEYELIPYMIAKGLITRTEFLQIQFHTTDKFDYLTRYKNIQKWISVTHELMWDCQFVWQSWQKKKDDK